MISDVCVLHSDCLSLCLFGWTTAETQGCCIHVLTMWALPLRGLSLLNARGLYKSHLPRTQEGPNHCMRMGRTQCCCFMQVARRFAAHFPQLGNPDPKIQHMQNGAEIATLQPFQPCSFAICGVHAQALWSLLSATPCADLPP